MKRLSIQISLEDTQCITDHVLSTLRDAVFTKQHGTVAFNFTTSPNLTWLILPCYCTTHMDSQSKQLKKLDTRKQQQRQKKKKKKNRKKNSLTSLTISKEE